MLARDKFTFIQHPVNSQMGLLHHWASGPSWPSLVSDLLSAQEIRQKLVLQEGKSLPSPVHSTHCLQHILVREDQYLSWVASLFGFLYALRCPKRL